ncbi:MAG TPA: type II toxin-antitoxin system VapC family toxin [Burkholderiaceae bacterium]|nr:type II toxin-antitoxin system VapC family toxin [Burkholderiaceae bacterium]
MIGLDTNVLVRYVAQDDARQTAQANALMESLTTERPGFIATVVLVEALWVMEDVYAASRERLAEIAEGLLQTDTLVVEGAERAWRALVGFRKGNADFADHLIARTCEAAGCSVTYTFDKTAARDGGMTLMSARAGAV